jgi:hypothetical protein
VVEHLAQAAPVGADHAHPGIGGDVDGDLGGADLAQGPVAGGVQQLHHAHVGEVQRQLAASIVAMSSTSSMERASCEAEARTEAT